ncbi:hypothetical protein [Maribacter sp. 2210JD10-5]|uniref:hypothetical protein n=1 Tax=Maribacter sp. 2210JD10-5 TaxID=3386272 RepID=UPI0039BD5581
MTLFIEVFGGLSILLGSVFLFLLIKDGVQSLKTDNTTKTTIEKDLDALMELPKELDPFIEIPLDVVAREGNKKGQSISDLRRKIKEFESRNRFYKL